MPAIITDQYRILNAETFVDSFVGIGTTGKNNYYTFLGHPNPTNITDDIGYGDSRWAVEPPNPIDNFDQENRYHDSMLFLKKVTSSDVRRVIPRINWQSGTIYEMYRNNYSSTNRTPQTATSGLYGSNFYVLTSEFKVYLCINNGSDPEHQEGNVSKFEPTHTSTTVPAADNTASGDGYQWKYLYTIAPSDIVKFVTSTYIPLPEKWGDVSNKVIKDAAVDGKLETIVIKRRGTANVNGTDGEVNVKIIGDGSDGLATVEVKNGVVNTIKLTNTNSKGYTYGAVQFLGGSYGANKQLTVGTGSDEPQFEVIIPPKGGHGADIFRELGGFRVMVYSKFDNNINDKSDYIIGNTFSRVGLIKDPLDLSGTSVLNKRTATSLGALKLKVPDNSSTVLSKVVYKPNTKITQYSSDSTVGVGTAVAYVASWDSNTGVLRYYQPVGFSTQSVHGYELRNFVGVTTSITGATHIEANNTVDNLTVDTSFNGESVTVGQRDEALGHNFVSGIANPEIKKYSGEVIYIDNRAPVTRTSSQKEEVKIVIEF
tara:strand:+ start:13156 stop:14778 length:1623 start_codon:yes stop_codon:yes gene_type:complete